MTIFSSQELKFIISPFNLVKKNYFFLIYLVEKMIEFIYTGETDLTEIPPQGLLELLQLSDEFLIESLQRISEKKLLNMLKVDNVCEILIICEKLKLKELKNHCLKFLIKNMPLIIQRPDYHKLLAFPAIMMQISHEVSNMIKHIN
jgi:hypothetical protein